MIWFSSDRHFDHKNIIKYCQRPFAVDRMNPTQEEAKAMSEFLIAEHNKLVKPDDTYFDMGDVAYCTTYDRALECWRRLNGKKHLITGNHDQLMAEVHANHPELFAGYYALPDPSVKCIVEKQIEGQIIIMSHYALREWHHDLRGTWHLFGHTHAFLPPFGKSMDVGVDAMNYRPVSFDEIKEFMAQWPIGPHVKFPHYSRSDTD